MRGGERYGAGRPGWHAQTCDVRHVHVRALGRHDPERWANGIEAAYRYTFSNGAQDIRQRIAIDWTPCRFGGFRAWFRCPRCNRRCTTIYFHGWPSCRRCARLVYPSQRVSGMAYYQAQRWALRRKLGDDVTGLLDEPAKPPRMRWRTYERYAARDAELAAREDATFLPFLARLLRKTGDLDY